MKRSRLLAVAASALLLAAPAAFAQQSAATPPGPAPSASRSNTPSTTTQLSAADRKYLSRDAKGGLFEIQASQLAVQKSQNAPVRRYAQTVVDDHAQSEPQMRRMAEQAGVTLPVTLNKRDQEKLAKLQAANGNDFDQMYVTDIKQVNRHDVAKERKEAARSADPQLKQLVMQEEQMDTKHAQAAKQLRAGGKG